MWIPEIVVGFLIGVVATLAFLVILARWKDEQDRGQGWDEDCRK